MPQVADGEDAAEKDAGGTKDAGQEASPSGLLTASQEEHRKCTMVPGGVTARLRLLPPHGTFAMTDRLRDPSLARWLRLEAHWRL